MTRIYSIPPREFINNIVEKSPEWMYPNVQPYAIVGPGILSDHECDWIIHEATKESPYSFHGCNALTREITMPLGLVYRPVVEFALAMNTGNWRFDLSENPGGWFQTYESGQDYQIHADTMIGVTRKLTAVALLTDPTKYDGGILRVVPWPDYADIPRTRGTIVVFPSWLMHQVYPVRRGIRQTLNVGFYGPAFR